MMLQKSNQKCIFIVFVQCMSTKFRTLNNESFNIVKDSYGTAKVMANLAKCPKNSQTVFQKYRILV